MIKIKNKKIIFFNKKGEILTKKINSGYDFIFQNLETNIKNKNKINFLKKYEDKKIYTYEIIFKKDKEYLIKKKYKWIFPKDIFNLISNKKNKEIIIDFDKYFSKKNNLLRLICFGDLHSKIPKLLVDKNFFDVIICSGDLSNKYFYKLTNLKKNDISPIQKILKYFNKFNKPCFLVPGNWDPTPCDGNFIFEKNKKEWEKILSPYKNIFDLEYKSKIYKKVLFLGHGSTSKPEILNDLDIDFFETEEEFLEFNYKVSFFKKVLYNIVKKIEKNKDKFKVFISHNPPYKTRLDLVDKKILIKNRHVGSKICKLIMQNEKDILNLCGHIHEGFGSQKIGGNLAINLGHGPNINTYIKIDSKNKKIFDYEFLGKNEK